MNVPIVRLNETDSPFVRDAAKSFTLPARFYNDPGVYELEKDAIFYRNWWYAGHVSQVAEPGNYITTEIHEQSVFIGRNGDGELSRSGQATPSDWLSADGEYAFGGRGGSWPYSWNHARTADRFKAYRTVADRRAAHIGWRGARSAPR